MKLMFILERVHDCVLSNNRNMLKLKIKVSCVFKRPSVQIIKHQTTRVCAHVSSVLHSRPGARIGHEDIQGSELKRTQMFGRKRFFSKVSVKCDHVFVNYQVLVQSETEFITSESGVTWNT